MPVFIRHISYYSAKQLLDHLDRGCYLSEDYNHTKKRLETTHKWNKWNRWKIRKTLSDKSDALMSHPGPEVPLILDVPDLGPPPTIPRNIVVDPDSSMSYSLTFKLSVPVSLEICHEVSTTFPDLVRVMDKAHKYGSKYTRMLEAFTTMLKTPTTTAEWCELAQAYRTYTLLMTGDGGKKFGKIFRQLGLARQRYGTIMDMRIELNMNGKSRSVETTLAVNIDLTK